jgi:hypothetical protein
MAQPRPAGVDLRLVMSGCTTESALVADDVGASRGALTSWRLLVAIMCVVVALIGVGMWALSNQIRSRTLGSTARGVMILRSVVIDRSLRLNDITDGIHPTNRARLDRDTILLKDRGQIIGLAIWALADGGLVYADVDNPAAGTLDPGLAAQARAGRPFAGSDADHPGAALEISYPYDANGDKIMDAVAQVVLPRQELDTSIAHATRRLNAGGAVVLLFVIVGILQVRRRQIVQDRTAVHDALTGLGGRILLRRLATPMAAPAHATESSAPVHCADVAMYRAKHAGSGVVAYDPSMDQHGDRNATGVAHRLGLGMAAPGSPAPAPAERLPELGCDDVDDPTAHAAHRTTTSTGGQR